MKKKFIYILLTIAAIFWGISFILTKELFLTEEHMTVTILIAMRLAVATCVMFPMLALTRKLQMIKKQDIKWFLLLAFCEPFIYHLCETSGVQLVSGSLASVVIATIPLFVPFGIWAAYRKRISLPILIGVVMSFVGVGIMLLGGEGLRGNIKGLLFLSGAVAIAVIYTLLLVKVVDHYNPIVVTTWQNLIGLIYFIPLVLVFDGSHLTMLSYSPRMFTLLLILGICCSTLAYACYNYGVRTLGAAEACIFNNAIPVFSLIAAVLLGQEQLSWGKIIGVIVVIAGVIIAQMPDRKSSPAPGQKE